MQLLFVQENLSQKVPLSTECEEKLLLINHF